MRPPQSAPFLRRLAAHAGRGHAGDRRRHHLSALYPRRLALFTRHHRRGDHQAADRRGRPRAGAARPCLSAGAARRAGGRLLGRRTPLSAAQRARAPVLRHEPGRADRAHRQHRHPARHRNPRLLSIRLLARRLRDPAQGVDRRPDPLLPGLFRRADERQSRAPAHDQVHARRFSAHRSAPAAAQGHVRRVAGAHHLLRVLRARVALRAAKSTAQRARPCACRRRRRGSCRSRRGSRTRSTT